MAVDGDDELERTGVSTILGLLLLTPLVMTSSSVMPSKSISSILWLNDIGLGTLVGVREAKEGSFRAVAGPEKPDLPGYILAGKLIIFTLLMVRAVCGVVAVLLYVVMNPELSSAL